MMENESLRKLLQKYTNGEALLPEEEFQLRQAYDQLLEEELSGQDRPAPGDEARGTVLRQKIAQQIAAHHAKRIRFNHFRRIAAVLLLGLTLLAGSWWLWPDNTVPQAASAKQEDIFPGNNKALLTLADGSVVALSDAPNGTVARQPGVKIEKNTGGNIRYIEDGTSGTMDAAMNTISTPRGGQYRITLPDGSVAMLNAASSLSYPVRFNEKERRVKMTGEVYFEIAGASNKDHQRLPFTVTTGSQEITVLGTHFNVNAYPDENAVRTTLVEGSVKVKAFNGQSALLHPGEQAVLTTKLTIQQADIQQQLAWVNGDFIFRGETLDNVLRQVERWYDVEATCPPHIGKLRFTGMISRSQPISAIVKMIQATKKANVTIKKRRFIVTS